MTDRPDAADGGGVHTVTVADDDAELRLDRWFKRHYPELGHGRLEKLIRTGQVRVDGRRAKAALRLEAGQVVRVPPLGDTAPPRLAKARPAPVSDDDAKTLRATVLYRDERVIALNKPPGLAVQGGSGTPRHLDGMLDALRFDAKQRPRLVHRLDRDTSGVLLLGRSATAAAVLAKAFQARTARKLYWAVTVGVPAAREGRIDRPLVKRGKAGGERVAAADTDDPDARRAVTLYRVADQASRQAAFVLLMPLTGRTHQLRAHLAALGTPVLGDGKYGGKAAFLSGLPGRLHLHARRLVVPLEGGPALDVTAPPPAHMAETFAFLGFDTGAGDELLD